MTTMPILFVGHGSPMNAIADNPLTKAWHALGRSLPKPKAILVISAHWQTHGVALTAMQTPRTIHDFGGFPKALFNVQYPAPGSPQLAGRARELLLPQASVMLDQEWGLDHGTWSVLRHLYPAADVPVVQLSMNLGFNPAKHMALAAALAPLRSEGVLIVGSGNIVHNLRTMTWQQPDAVFDWAQRFSDKVKAHLAAKESAALADLTALDEDGVLAVNSAEHYLPFLYILALREAADELSYPVQGIEHGSIDMTSVLFSRPA